MKKYLIIASIILVIPFIVQADKVEFPNPLKSNNFWCMIDGIIHFVFIVSLPIAVIMYIVAGFFFSTSLGQEEKIATAKKIMLWTTIGLLVVFLSRGIILIILEIFGQTMGTLNC